MPDSAGRETLTEALERASRAFATIRERLNPLVCVECGEKAEEGAHGWRTYLTVDNEPATYCPQCAGEEFGDA